MDERHGRKVASKLDPMAQYRTDLMVGSESGGLASDRGHEPEHLLWVTRMKDLAKRSH